MTKARPEAELRLCRAEVPLEERTDDELMQLANAGAELAFEQLIRRHQASLRTYCARLCGAGSGDEIAQEVLLSLWDVRASYQTRGQFRAFLFRLAERRCLNDLRARGRARRRADREHEGSSTTSTPLDELLTRERQRRLDESLAKLPGEQRRAILLRYAAGLDFDEIAALVQRPAATVRNRVFLGLAKLRRLVTKAGER